MRTGRPDYDAALTAPEDLIPLEEPVFIIRGQDICAADAVRDYASRLKLAGASPEMVDAVRTQAARMDLWPVKKTPDRPVTDAAKAREAYEASRRDYSAEHPKRSAGR